MRRFAWWCRVAALAAAISAGSPARAQQDDIVMPAPIGPTEPPYPEHARGDAEVTLILTIRADGTVSRAEVSEGPEPFTTAAREAATSWRFSPAHRNGKPFASRIRFKVVFHAPPEPEPPPGPPDKAPAPDKAPPGDKAPAPDKAPPGDKPLATSDKTPPPAALEVMIEGDRPAPMTRSLTRQEVRQMPGAFGDPFRAVEALPGVTPIATGVPYFFVRGAPPGNVGYYLDGIRVPLLYHVALGPSVIHPALVERVDLYPGGYPAKYGRFAGGIVSGEVKEPERKWHGEGNVRLFDAGAMVEAPFDDGRGAALVAGRYSYTGALLSVFSPEIDLNYWDYQARVSYELTPQHRIGVFAFGARDYLAQTRDGEKRVVLEGGFHRVDLRYDARFPKTTLRQAVTFGLDESGTRDGQQSGRSWLVGTRTELTARLSDEVTVRAGADAYFERFDISITDDDGELSERDKILLGILTTRDDFAASVHADVVLRPVKALEITPGLRGDLFTSGGVAAVSLSPRLSARASATSRIAILGSFGLATQPPAYLGAIPGQQVGGLRGGLQQGLLASAGVEVKLPLDIMATVTGFKNGFFNLSDALGNRPPQSDQGNVRRAELRAMGEAYGLEVFMRRSFTNQLGGFLSYTLSRSIRSIERDVFDAGFDRRHVLNLALAYDFGKGWKAGMRFVLYSGVPTTIDYDPPGFGNDNRNGNGGNGNGGNGGFGGFGDGRDRYSVVERALREKQRKELEAYVKRLDLGDRMPAFARLDVRGEKRWNLGKGRWISLTLEVQNATSGKEILQYECDYNGCKSEPLGPIVIPSLGVEAGF